MLIDGQQRLTTISILLCAIYDSFKEFSIEIDPLSAEYKKYLDLRYMIALGLSENVWKPRVVPQDINENDRTYKQILKDIGFDIIVDLPYAKNRKIYRAFSFFKNKISSDLSREFDIKQSLFSMYEKVTHATVVDITVGDMSDALQIFTTLNHRGVPLSPADLIKTLIITHLEIDVNQKLDGWDQLIAYIVEDDEKVSDRFFKAFANSFGPYVCSEYGFEYTIFKSDNLIKEYEKLIKTSPSVVYREMTSSASDYAKITCKDTSGNTVLDDSLQRLSRLDSATSYTLLLYLYRRYKSKSLNEKDFEVLVEYLIKFYVRRNLTDRPQARGIPQLYQKIIEETLYMDSSSIVKYIIRELTDKSASLDDFRVCLEGPIYEDSPVLTRFMLASICDRHNNNEFTSPWECDKSGKPIWTVEHILPQNDKLSEDWIKMTANGDAKEASLIQSRCVHKIGNLTLSGNNSSLSDDPFIKKRDAQKDGVNIGYNNGLWLNRHLAKAERWDESSIESRSEEIIRELIDIFKFDSEI